MGNGRLPNMMDCLHWAAIPSCLQGNDLEQVQEFELPNCICLVTPVACRSLLRKTPLFQTIMPGMCPQTPHGRV